MSYYRTITAVVEIWEDSDLEYPGNAAETARKALESAGFVVVRIRNAPNQTGDMPDQNDERADR